MSSDDVTQFTHLVLLIGTNPLPNFVVADFFLHSGIPLERIWLVYSEKNDYQAGTFSQAENLERLLSSKWKGKAPTLKFPLKKISLADVGDGKMIRMNIREKMIQSEKWPNDVNFHLNYTGGTKVMATHVYLQLQKNCPRGKHPFSYLDANNFRLLLDGKGLFPLPGAADLRTKVFLSFADLIRLHGFSRTNQGNSDDSSIQDTENFNKLIASNPDLTTNGHFLERCLYTKIKKRFEKKLGTQNDLLLNWVIKKSDWTTRFELDIIVMQGYQLTGISCTITGSRGEHRKKRVKLKGFEIIHRCRQIGGDEAKAIIVSSLGPEGTRELQEELEYDTGGTKKNILALGLDDLKMNDKYLTKIEKLIFS